MTTYSYSGKHGVLNIEKGIPHETNVYIKTAKMMQSGDSVYFENDKDAEKLAKALWAHIRNVAHNSGSACPRKVDVDKTKREGTGRRVWLLY